MRTSLVLFSTATLCLTIAALAGCKRSATPPAPAASPTAEAYDIRGIIEKLPTAKAPHQLTVHTETTNDMEAMTMSYALDSGVSVADLAVGDKVSLHVETDAKSGAERVTKMEKLPTDTALKIPGATTATAPATGKTKSMHGM